LVIIGCARSKREQQLHRVSKDWCETIRASQVIPVYPLTEDIRPGDVFLVRTPIAQQSKEWKDRGFLPLDDHRVRLGAPRAGATGEGTTIDYSRLYFSGYWRDVFHSSEGNARPVLSDPGRLQDGGANPNSQRQRYTTANAPRAAFPSYEFEVRTSEGLGASFPIKGIPVGLSFMQTDRANVSVSIVDAYTYAAEAGQLYELLRSWVEGTPGVRSHLADAFDQSGRPVFLRVVSRVYLAGAIAVTMTSAQAGGFQGQAGFSAPLSAPTGSATTLESTKQVLEELDKRANAPSSGEAALPSMGGAVRFTWATNRSVSLNEAFPTPLVVGYLGFDVPVFEDGRLGFPLPTWGVLNRSVTSSGVNNEVLYGLELLVQLAGGTEGSRTRALTIISSVSEAMRQEDIESDRFRGYAESAERLSAKPKEWDSGVLPLVRELQVTEAFLNDQQRRSFHLALSRAFTESR